jgi:hypothetical protein
MADDVAVPLGELPSLDPEALQYLIHHVFLPPKLPQKSDTSSENDRALFEQICAALKAFEEAQWTGDSCSCVSTINMIDNMTESRSPIGILLEDQVDVQLGSMNDRGA